MDHCPPPRALARLPRVTFVAVQPVSTFSLKDYPPPPRPPPPPSCCRILFGFGFLFPFFWLVGACLPCCSKAVNDRRAAIASGVALAAVAIVVVVFAVALPLSLDWYATPGKEHMATSWGNAI